METRDMDEIVLARVSGQELTAHEEELFSGWYASEQNRSRYDALLRARSGVVAARAAGVDRGRAWRRIDPPQQRPRAVSRIMRYAAVIAIPVCTLLGLLLWQERDGADLVAVMPGGGVAILTTYDGTQVALDRTDGTAFDVHGNAVPIGNESVPASAEPADELPDPAYGQYNTIEIPRGGFYRVVLSDGSTVWLNNESRIRFPRRFDEHARVVTLEGEAYFQVEKDAQRPFIVQTGDYEIRVTGTRFNVRSYAPGTTTTTLVDGGVQIEMDGRVSTLAPNQQATIDNGVIAVREVKTEQYVAWQQGAFSFAQTRLDQIMDELSRWYDIEVEWKDLHARNYHFSAWFDRSSELSEIIEVLEKTNRVKMTLRGRTLTIRDK